MTPADMPLICAVISALVTIIVAIIKEGRKIYMHHCELKQQAIKDEQQRIEQQRLDKQQRIEQYITWGVGLLIGAAIIYSIRNQTLPK